MDDGDTNKSADDGTLCVDADTQNILELPTGGGYLCSDPISNYYLFSTYDSISTWYNIDYTKALDKLKELILDRVNDVYSCSFGLHQDLLIRS